MHPTQGLRRYVVVLRAHVTIPPRQYNKCSLKMTSLSKPTPLTFASAARATIKEEENYRVPFLCNCLWVAGMHAGMHSWRAQCILNALWAPRMHSPMHHRSQNAFGMCYGPQNAGLNALWVPECVPECIMGVRMLARTRYGSQSACAMHHRSQNAFTNALRVPRCVPRCP